MACDIAPTISDHLPELVFNTDTSHKALKDKDKKQQEDYVVNIIRIELTQEINYRIETENWFCNTYTSTPFWQQ